MPQSPHYVGLDISHKMTAICMCNQAGENVYERKVATDPEAIALALFDQDVTCMRVGLEAGALSQWLYEGLARAGLPVVCVEARHAHDFIKSQINKNDRNDARGIAKMMLCGVYKPVHIKTPASQRARVLLSARKTIQTEVLALEANVRGELNTFGLRIGAVTPVTFEARASELIEGDAALQMAIEPLLVARRALREQFDELHKTVLSAVRQDPVCVRLMTAPGVGPVVALTFRAVIDIPQRFRSSKDVPAIIGLTPRQHQSGEMDCMGGISKLGDHGLRTALVEAGLKVVINVKQPSALRTWALEIAKRKGTKKAAVAVARRLAMILHRMWLDETDFDAQAASFAHQA